MGVIYKVVCKHLIILFTVPTSSLLNVLQKLAAKGDDMMSEPV